MEINRALRGLPTVVRRAGKLGEITVSIPITFKITPAAAGRREALRHGTCFVKKKKTRLKHPRNTRRGGSLREIVNTYLNYFTELARFISTLFQPYFVTRT